MIFFVLILGLRLQRYSTNAKRYPPKKVFWNSEFCSSHQNHSSLNYEAYCGFGWKNKTQSFKKLFSGGHLFVYVEYLCNRSPKIKTKNIKNYSSILAIVNHWNWLDDSPPLRSWFVLKSKMFQEWKLMLRNALFSCAKLVKDKYLAKLHVSSSSTTESDSDEASEIENWLFDFSTSFAKPIPKKPKQIDARSTLVHFADKMFTNE